MADLAGTDQSQLVGITGLDSSGVETYTVGATTDGRLKVDASVAFPSSAIDAFGRLRVSDPVTKFDSKLILDEQSILWETTLVGAATTTYNDNEASVSLTTTTASGDIATRESHGYIQYTPGKSQLIDLTGIIGGPVTNTVQRIGSFNDDDGLFFECDGTSVSVVVRSNASGSVVHDRVRQTNWNIDDGTGIDWTKVQIFVINFQWLGVGKVEFAVVDEDGSLRKLHRFEHSNIDTTVYMATPDLPVRYQIENTGTSAGASIKQICCSVQSEGGVDDNEGFVFGWDDETNTKTIGAAGMGSVVGFRLATTFNSKENRMKVKPVSFAVRSSADIFLRIYVAHAHLGETSAFNGTWASIDADSGLEFSDDITTFTETNKTIFTDYIVAANKGQSSLTKNAKEKYVIALNAAGTTSDIVHVIARSFTGNASVTFNATFREVY